MNPGDLGEVPTLASLNKAQKRALILRDQLRYLEPAHLDTFLDGITRDEPPTYKSVNGAVYPPFAQVTIKQEATRFDLGNVHFSEGDGALFRAYLTVEDERFEMRTEDALPKNDADLGSVAIYQFIAQNMFPLFKAKYKAIHARMEKINEARRVAYNMLDHPPAKFEDGETLARLTAKSKPNDESSRDGGSRKRKEITKHVSNKRQRIGLEVIPDTVKSETFNTIPTQIKVDLFNNIIKTAFPNFDNLITASWNVVSVYSNVGSDFPELHKAVVELKGALEEFENGYATPRSKGSKSRKEANSSRSGGSGSGGGSGSRATTPTKEGRDTASPAAQANPPAAEQPHTSNESASLFYHDSDPSSPDPKPPPQLLQMTPQTQQTQQAPHPSSRSPKQDPSPSPLPIHLPPPPPPLRPSTRPPSLTRRTSGTPPLRTTTPVSTPPDSTSDTSQHNRERDHNRNRRSRDPSTERRGSTDRHDSRDRRSSTDRHGEVGRYASTDRHGSTGPYPPHALAPGSELMRKRMEYTASLGLARGSHQQHQHQHQQRVLAREVGDGDDGEEDDYEQGEVVGEEQMEMKGLGNSVLGAKKRRGELVPVANMLGVRREGGGGSGGRRGH